jgi:hypothetical protein
MEIRGDPCFLVDFVVDCKTIPRFQNMHHHFTSETSWKQLSSQLGG